MVVGGAGASGGRIVVAVVRDCGEEVMIAIDNDVAMPGGHDADYFIRLELIAGGEFADVAQIDVLCTMYLPAAGSHWR